MKPLVHILFSLILAVVLYPIFNWRVLFVLAGGFLIDIDHYLWHIYKYKKFNLINSYKFYMKNIEVNDFTNVTGILLIFHTIEFFLIIIFLSFYNQFVLLFLIGLLGHYLLDLIWCIRVPKRVIVNHSIIWWITKNKLKIQKV